jgi:radical SAM-linked protein
MRLTAETLRNTGNREIGLLSLSTADYSQVDCLTKDMARAFSKDRVSISLPSLRADMFSVSLAENVGEVKKNGFTFAPEAGSERMRKFINKNISNEELFQAIETAYRQGWNLIKLYFMIGLPTETDADIRELVGLIREVGKIGKKFKGGKNVNASIGTFVPKSFTPFQWDRFEDLRVTTERLNYLRSAVRFPFARLKWHNPRECFIEGVLSRGDRQVGRAVLKAYQLGCRFDGWDEMFNYDLWLKAFEESGVDPHFYNRDIALHELLPWDFIDIGVSKKFLLKERARSYERVQTYDCKWGDCRGCGIPGNYADIKLAAVPEQDSQERLVQLTEPMAQAQGRFTEKSRSDPTQLISTSVTSRSSASPVEELVKVRDVNSSGENSQPPKCYILHYWKEESARFLSHLNVMKLMERALIRANFRLRFTEGFNPHPKFATSPAIPLGMASHSEFIQFEAYGNLPEDPVTRINEFLSEGLSVQSIVPFDSKGKWSVTQPLQVIYKASLDPKAVDGVAPLLADLLGRVYDLINHLSDHYKGNDFWCSSKDHERIVDLWVVSENPVEIGFELSMNPETGLLLKPKDFLEQVLSCPPELAKKFLVAKESVSFQ